MSEEKRDSLRKILVGGGVIGASQVLPSKWTNAVVQSVVVPAHAQMSVLLTFNGTGPIPV